MSTSRRDFIKKTAITTAGFYTGASAFSASSYRRIVGSNDRIRVGVVGFSDRHRSSHMPSFLNFYKELNFDIVAVSILGEYLSKVFEESKGRPKFIRKSIIYRGKKLECASEIENLIRVIK